VFIDDAPHNVAAAQSVGMDAIRFTTPDALEVSLKDRGLL
jgi:2-haloacid dehalogenase